MLGGASGGIAYDGQRIWTSNEAGSVSLVTLNPTVVTTISTGFTSLHGVLYDGANMWVTDDVAGTVDKLRKLDSSGAILQSADVGSIPFSPAFDGTNIWVPNQESSTVSVVRATGGLAATVLATLSGNGLNGPLTAAFDGEHILDGPRQAAFDGERILVTNFGGDAISLWSATALTPIGTFSTGVGSGPLGACSDGINFWITLDAADKLARF